MKQENLPGKLLGLNDLNGSKGKMCLDSLMNYVKNGEKEGVKAFKENVNDVIQYITMHGLPTDEDVKVFYHHVLYFLFDLQKALAGEENPNLN